MLNGIDPIIIFQLYKLIPSTTDLLANIPITAEVKKRATVAIIPIYLSEKITGIYIDTESKNIDIETNVDSLTSGDPALVNQKTLGSIVTVNLKASANSVGLTILSAMAELLLDKVTSQEYEMTYIHQSTTIFGGLLHSFSVDQGGNDDLLKIKLEIARGRPKTNSVLVKEDPNAVRLGTSGVTPPTTAPTVPGGSSTGQSVIAPRLR